MLCKTASPGSTYNELRKQDKCNVIVIMRSNRRPANHAFPHKPNYVLDENSLTISKGWNKESFDENFHLKDDPCETMSSPKFSMLNHDNIGIKNRHKLKNMAQTFHLSSAVFKPYGYDVIDPNFVDDRIKWLIDNPFVAKNGALPTVKKTAKTSLRHWTKERVYVVVILY